MKINNLEFQQLISSSEEELREITGGHPGPNSDYAHPPHSDNPDGSFWGCAWPIANGQEGHPKCYIWWPFGHY